MPTLQRLPKCNKQFRAGRRLGRVWRRRDAHQVYKHTCRRPQPRPRERNWSHFSLYSSYGVGAVCMKLLRYPMWPFSHCIRLRRASYASRDAIHRPMPPNTNLTLRYVRCIFLYSHSGHCFLEIEKQQQRAMCCYSWHGHRGAGPDRVRAISG